MKFNNINEIGNEVMFIQDSGVPGTEKNAGISAAQLTAREIAILHCLAVGGRDKQIANKLGISVKTVNHHVKSIIKKLEAVSRAHAVAKAILLKAIKLSLDEVASGVPSSLDH